MVAKITCRPQMDRDAPWSVVSKKPRKMKERTRAVVYVAAADGSDWTKVGFTTALKSRLQSLSAKAGERLNICFWGELPPSEARPVEGRAKRTLAKIADRNGEWFAARPEIVAGAVCAAAKDLGFEFHLVGGFPGAPDHVLSEVEQMAKEADHAVGGDTRLPRGLWRN